MILVAGDIMLDVLLLPELRSEEQGAGILLRGGGSAANTAAWIADQGEAVCFAGCVGQDGAGAMLADELAAGGVSLNLRRVPGLPTGAVVVQVGPAGERVMRSSRGANEALAASDLDTVPTQTLDVIHLTGYALLAPGGEALLRLAAGLAHDAGAILSFDPSSTGVINRIGSARLPDLLSGVTLLLPNAPEAMALTGRLGPDAAVQLSERFPVVVVKDGAAGAHLAVAGAVTTVPTDPLASRDTTGAGDAFNAGFLVAVRHGAEYSSACRRGHALAARAIMAYGGRPVPQ